MKHAIVIACAVLLSAGCGNMRSESAAHEGDAAPQGEVMKIRFERSGGFAGMMTSVDVDADSLPDAERQALATLVSNAGFFALPSKVVDSAAAGADRFNYRITIESDGRTHTVETTDGSAPASLVPLLDWLSGAARRARTPGGM